MSDLPTGARLHAWNTSFEWTVPRGPFQVLTAEQARQFDGEGYVVLEDMIAPAEIDAVIAAIDPLEQMTDAFLRAQNESRFYIAESGAITFSPHLVARSPELRRFAAHPLFMGLCRDLIGPDVNLYWDQAVYKKPEKPRRFPWHQDNGYTFIEPQQYLTCWVALTEATEENGCPWVAPRIHRRGTLRHTYVEPLGYECFTEPPQRVPAPAKAGGVVVFSSLTPHLTGPNTSTDVRKAYILQYAPVGARVKRGDPEGGPPAADESCDNADWQFPVLRGGVRVES